MSAFLAEAILGSPFSIATNADFGFINGSKRFGFDISGGALQAVVIQASTNLAHWAPLQTNRFGGPSLYFSDPQSANSPRQFYRVLPAP